MCGIIGFVGNENACPFLLNGLEKLEYRGYDSAGVAIHDEKKINILKAKGKLAELEKKIEFNNLRGNIGIGHMRWATHGKVSEENAHPQSSVDNKIVLVHNGIIENYLELKNEFDKNIFISDTDTEVIAHLIYKYYDWTGILNDFIDAVYFVLQKLKGSYALAIMCEDFKDKIFAVKKDSPLVIGIGENKNFVASDISAFIKYTNKVCYLNDNELAVIDEKDINVFDENKNILNKKVDKIYADNSNFGKDNYDSFMLKEIFEQPKVIKNFLMDNRDNFLEKINLDEKILDDIERIYLIGCGTAYYACLMGEKLLSKLNLFVSAETASEFRYSNWVVNKKSLVIVVSQSGETADSLAALRIAKKNGAKILSIVNVRESSIARESDFIININAGPEISVASTKAFSLMLIAFDILSCCLYKYFKIISHNEFLDLKNDLGEIPELVERILKQHEKIKSVAEKYLSSKNIFYLGRNLDYVIALEGALKLKEIAYLNAQAYPSGELKHGPIALVDENTLIVGIATQKNIFDKTLSNLEECKARNGKILVITQYENENSQDVADDIFILPECNQIFIPLLANIYLQLFAYYVAKNLGRDIDKPKNLAKSVTVE
ncbi:MAG: glutamine--fructose-6-phosphate transaminase (isomerizing) [Firmicutes bacterium]|nr:glutamine--fructose-6-phosphate transaminase (isomerizing) [Bacillota bacterium]